MRDTIVVTIEPTKPRDRLDISEAFKQVLDILELVEQAAGAGARFDWKLERASTNSPFTVVAAAPGARSASRRGDSLPVAQAKVQEGLAALSDGHIPTWMRKPQRTTARRVARRYRDGVGRITLKTDETAKRQFAFNTSMANKALKTLEKVDGIEDMFVPAHQSYGEIEGTLLEVSDYRGQPSLLIRTNGYDVVRGIIGKDNLDKLGQTADLGDIWKHSRVKLTGKLWYQDGGELDRIAIDEFKLFPSHRVALADITDPEFTAGMKPSDYLDQLHNGGGH